MGWPNKMTRIKYLFPAVVSCSCGSINRFQSIPSPTLLFPTGRSCDWPHKLGWPLIFVTKVFVDIQNKFLVVFSVGFDILFCVVICSCPLGVQYAVIIVSCIKMKLVHGSISARTPFKVSWNALKDPLILYNVYV